jgi:copper chaperone
MSTFMLWLRLKMPLNTRGITMFVLDVSGIGCGSCIRKITNAIQSLDNKATVSVDRDTGKVNVESNESPERVRAVVDALGFPSKISA